jgi:hypothetical protein
MTHLTVHEWGRVGVHNDGGTVPERHFSRGEANALLAAAREHPLCGNEGTAILVDHHRHLTTRLPDVALKFCPRLTLTIFRRMAQFDIVWCECSMLHSAST